MLMASKAAAPSFVFPAPTQGHGRILHFNCLSSHKLSAHLHGDEIKNRENVIHYINDGAERKDFNASGYNKNEWRKESKSETRTFVSLVLQRYKT